jgi:3-oxoacyl-[acyl-carrier protein] reductase
VFLYLNGGVSPFEENLDHNFNSLNWPLIVLTKKKSMPDKKNKVAIVTGASRGIGAATSERLAKDGFSILVNYSSSDPTEAEAVAARVRAAGAEVRLCRGNVSDPKTAKQMFDLAEFDFGGVDVLINNAGIYELAKIGEMDDETFDRVVAVNLKGTFNFMREAANRMRNGGRVINVSSSAIGLKLETYGIYVATKAALEAMTQIMSKEMRGRKISVNAIAPGQTATKLFLDGRSERELDRVAKMNPYERLGTPEDMAATIAFLCSPEGEWINGQIIRINGGTV